MINPAFEGALFEELVGQELLALDAHDRRDLLFWTREEKGASSETDYVFQSGNRLFPVEVKAGSHDKLLSLPFYVISRINDILDEIELGGKGD